MLFKKTIKYKKNSIDKLLEIHYNFIIEQCSIGFQKDTNNAKVTNY